MKPAEARRLAEHHSIAELQSFAEILSEERDPPIAIIGEALGDKLTHVLLAMRIRERVDVGESMVDAYREVFAGVREVLRND